MLRWAPPLALACLAWPGAVCAQHVLEVISLRHSTAGQVIPALRPLLEPGGALSGQYSQLIVRTSPGNLAEIRRALEAIDRPRRRLQILVRFGDSGEASRERVEASGTVGRRGVDIDVAAHASRSNAASRVDQRIQVVEGGRAFIGTGESRPIRERETIRTPGGVVRRDTVSVHEAHTGFEVIPHVSGNRVTLDIAPQRESFAGTPVPGAVASQRAQTSLSGRLGEWLEIGGSVSSATRGERALTSASRSTASESRQIWVKVEELAN